MADILPAQQVANNAKVLSKYLGLVVDSLDSPEKIIPFFSTDSLDVQSLISKSLRDAHGYGTFSETGGNSHIQLVSAIQREAGFARSSRSGLWGSALAEIAMEKSVVDKESFLQSRVVEGRSVEQNSPGE